MNNRRTITAWALACLIVPLLAWVTPVRADDYPNRIIHLIVPYGPGNGTDLIARSILEITSQELGRPMIIENRAGGNGVVGTMFASEAKPDGYTLLVGANGTIVTGPYIQSGLKYDPAKAFIPVAMLAYSPFVLIVPNGSSIRSVRDLVEAARAQPGKLTYGSTGVGSSGHLAGALFEREAGVRMRHIPYTGAGATLLDIIAGRIDCFFAAMPSVYTAIKSGQVRAIAMATVKRSPQLPELSTVAEAGYPNFDTGTWVSIMALAGTPPEVVDKLYQSIAKAVNAPATEEFFGRIGADPYLMDPKQLGDYLADQRKIWEVVIRDVGLAHK